MKQLARGKYANAMRRKISYAIKCGMLELKHKSLAHSHTRIQIWIIVSHQSIWSIFFAMIFVENSHRSIFDMCVVLCKQKT